MDFSKEEVRTILEALGKRYKSMRARPGSPDDTRYLESVRALDSVIKRFMHYQDDNFPADASEDTADPLPDAEVDSEQFAPRLDYGNFRLLLVDDNDEDRNKLRALLDAHGFQHVDESDDGHSAIACIKEKPRPYDLVLCDVNMPTISGLDVVKLIRQEEKFADMPFVMMSKQGQKKQLEQALEAGVSGYIVKPLTADKLLPKIDMVLQ